MKKFMSALLVAVFCASAMADVLLYDYAATFKRITVADKAVKVKYGDVSVKLDSPKVTSDKFTGLVVIPACEDCSDEDPVMAASADDNYVLVYVRRGNKKNALVYRTIGTLYTNKFGAKAGVKNDEEIGKFTDVSAVFEYALDDEVFVAPYDFADFFGKGYVDGGVLTHTGFGKLQVKTEKIYHDDDCDPYYTSYSCEMIKSVNGGFVGVLKATGTCSDFLIDICDDANVDDAAPIYGTWSLKLNNKYTFDKKAIRFTDFSDAALAIEAKLASDGAAVLEDASDADIVDLDEGDYKPEEEEEEEEVEPEPEQI